MLVYMDKTQETNVFENMNEHQDVLKCDENMPSALNINKSKYTNIRVGIPFQMLQRWWAEGLTDFERMCYDIVA